MILKVQFSIKNNAKIFNFPFPSYEVITCSYIYLRYISFLPVSRKVNGMCFLIVEVYFILSKVRKNHGQMPTFRSLGLACHRQKLTGIN